MDVTGTLFDRLQQTAKRYPQNPAFVVPERLTAHWGLDEPAWTYQHFLERTEDLYRQFAAAGLGDQQEGDVRVALLLGNQPDFYAHWLALNALGVSIVPVNPDYRRDEIAHLFATSGARLAIVVADQLENVQDGAAASGRAVRVVEHRQPVGPAESPSGAPPPADGACSAGTREAALLFTSGTTSRPKACILSNDYFLYWGERYPALGELVSLQPGQERLLQPLPSFHINALANAFAAMLAIGGCLVPIDRFHPRQWWRDAAETGATCFHYLGVMPAILLALPPGPDDRAHALRFGMGGGVEPAQHALFEERFGVPLCEGWAMTEGGATALMVDGDPPRHVGRRCIGRPGAHQDFRLVAEDGAVLEGAATGELQIRHSGDDPRKGFFSGYLGDPQATAAAWHQGWFATGDVVSRDADGFLFFAERRKNIIRRSGENITPGEVAAVLGDDPAVRQVVVLPRADPVRQEEVMAVVEAEDAAADLPALADRLFSLCYDRLAYYKAPGWIVFVDTLPTTATQKVRQDALQPMVDQAVPGETLFDLRTRKKRH